MRGVSASRAIATGSKARASRAGSAATTTSPGQRDCASRRRNPISTASRRAAGDAATTRFACTTANGCSGSAPAATTDQSGQHSTNVRMSACLRVDDLRVDEGGHLRAPIHLVAHRHRAVRAWQPERGRAHARRTASSRCADRDSARRQVPGPVPDSVPLGVGDGAAQVDRERARCARGQRAPHPVPEPAPLSGARQPSPLRRSHQHDVDRVDECSDDRCPVIAFGRADHREAVERDAPFRGSRKTEPRDAHCRDP